MQDDRLLVGSVPARGDHFLFPTNLLFGIQREDETYYFLQIFQAYLQILIYFL